MVVLTVEVSVSLLIFLKAVEVVVFHPVLMDKRVLTLIPQIHVHYWLTVLVSVLLSLLSLSVEAS